MKKLLTGWIVLLLAIFQSPIEAFAAGYGEWGTLQYAFDTDWANVLSLPIQMNNNITAPNSGGNLGTTNALGSVFWTNGYTLTGDGTVPVIWVNEDFGLSIFDGSGNGVIANRGSTTVATIQNNGPLTLSGVTLENGLSQNTFSSAVTYIGDPHNNSRGVGVVFSGANNITTGEFSFAPGTADAYANFGGGTIAQGAKVCFTGPDNVFNIQGGSVVLDSGTGDQWEMGSAVTLSGTGTLTLNNFTHNTAATDENGGSSYIQTGGTLNLTNSSTLTLNNQDGSYIRGGTIAISNSNLGIYNGLTNHANVSLSSGSFTIGNDTSANATSFTLDSGSTLNGGTVNIGSAGGANVGNTLVVGPGAAVNSAATVNIFQGNNFNITGGTAALDSADTWAGTVNVTNGILNLTGLTHSDTSGGAYTQTGGTLNLQNASSLTLSNMSSITTNGSGSGTTTVNIGTSAGHDGSSLTLAGGTTIQTANAADNLILNVGTNTSTGNSLNIATDFMSTNAQIVLNASNTLNLQGGTVILNGSGAGADTWAGTVNLSGSQLYLDNFTHNTLAGAFSQTRGILWLTGGSSLTLNSGDSIAATNWNTSVNIGNGNSPWDTGNSLNMNDGTLSASNPNGLRVNIAAGNQFNVSGGSIGPNVGVAIANGGSFNLSGGSASMGSEWVWNGAINLSGTGSLAVSSFDSTGNAPFGTYTQNGAGTSLSLSNSSIFTLGTGSSINSGNVSLDGTSALFVEGGTIAEAAVFNLPSSNGGGLKITGGSVTLNGSVGSYAADTWNNASMFTMTGGSLTLDSMAHSATTDTAYIQSGGTLNLKNASSLSLANGNGITTSGTGSGTTTVNIGTASGADGSSLTVGSGGVISANNSGDTLVVNVGSSTSTGNSLNIAGGTLNASASVVLNANNTLNISDGNVTLNQSGQGSDTLIGAVNLSGGNLTVDSIVSHGAFTMTGGNLYFGTDSAAQSPRLFASPVGTPVDGEHHLHGGTVIMRNNGALTLQSPDTWTTTNFMVNGGTFTLNNFTHDSTSAATPGNLYQTGGTVRLINGSVLGLDDNSHILGGSFVNNGTLNLTTASSREFGASLSGSGTINKNGAGSMLFSGMNSGFTGDFYINAGTANFSNAQAYLTGTTHLNGGNLGLSFAGDANFGSNVILQNGSTLTLNTNGHNVISPGNFISSTAGQNNTVIIGGPGTFSVQANNANFNFNLQVNQGTMQVSSNAVNFNEGVTVGQGPGNPAAFLNLSAGTVNFNNGLSLSNGHMSLATGGFNVNGGLSVGSTINTMNGALATNNITGNLNVGPSGTAEFLVDISPRTGTADRYNISGNITSTNPGGVIDISNFNIVDLSDARNVHVNIFSPAGTIDPGVVFTATNGIVTSPLARYSLSSFGNGSYDLNWVGYNPQVFRGQVATESAYAHQLTINNDVFDHAGMVSRQLLAGDSKKSFATGNSPASPYQYNKKEGGVWFNAYGSLERLQLSQDISTHNDMWGTLLGADLPLFEFDRGMQFLPSVYFGYTGGNQSYGNVSMHQDGYQVGIMGTMYMGQFSTSLLANVGTISNDMSVAGTTDHSSTWFAGVASKSAYDFGLTHNLTLQPNLLISYNAFGSQSWHSGYGGYDMTANALNGLNLAPGLNLILDEKTWSVYAMGRAVFNIKNGVSGSIQDISLPTVEMGTAYYEYGLGVTKRIDDKVSLNVQSVFNEGVRTGVGFQGGLEWKF